MLIKRCIQSFQNWKTSCASLRKAKSFIVMIIPPTACHGGPYFFHLVCLHIHKTSSGRSTHPFMETSYVRIAANDLHIYFYLSNSLSTIKDGEDSPLRGFGTYFFHRKNRSTA